MASTPYAGYHPGRRYSRSGSKQRDGTADKGVVPRWDDCVGLSWVWRHKIDEIVRLISRLLPERKEFG